MRQGPRGPAEARPDFGSARAAQDAPLWLPETQDLLRRLAEESGGLVGGATTDIWPHLAADRPTDSGLARTLEGMRTRYLPAQGLDGALTFEEALPELDAPEAPLRSIFEHLIEGGLRGNPAAQPYCHFGVADDTADFVTLYVHDNGAPLPECSMEELRAFIRKEKVENVPDRVYRLFLADNLAQWLGGRIWLGPAANGRGTTILVRLPKARAGGPAKRTSPLLARHVF